MWTTSIRRVAAALLASSVAAWSVPVSGDEPAADVPTYRGDAARSGLMPGPGPAGTPRIVWTFGAGAPIASQVAVADGVGYLVSVVGSVYALDIATGSELWRADTGAPTKAGPSVDQGLVMVASGDGVDAFDARDGSRVWASAETGSVSGTPAVVDGMVVSASEDGLVSSLEVGEGQPLWQAEIGIATANSVAADESAELAVIGGQEGVAVAVDLADGNIRWRYDTQDSARIGTPTIGGGLVYLATLEGGGPGTRRLHAVDVATGERVWVVPSPGDAPAFAPALADDRAIVSGEDGSVTAMDPATGQQLWRYDAPGVVETVAAIADGVVYVASNGGLALALDAATGTELWRVPIEGIPYGITVTGELVLVGTTSGTLYAIGGSAA